MKFYVVKIKTINLGSVNITRDKLCAIVTNTSFDLVSFFKNGTYHNAKNAAYISHYYQSFYLNGTTCGKSNKFTKESWRRFVKLQFLK